MRGQHGDSRGAGKCAIRVGVDYLGPSLPGIVNGLKLAVVSRTEATLCFIKSKKRIYLFNIP